MVVSCFFIGRALASYSFSDNIKCFIIPLYIENQDQTSSARLQCSTADILAIYTFTDHKLGTTEVCPLRCRGHIPPKRLEPKYASQKCSRF